MDEEAPAGGTSRDNRLDQHHDDLVNIYADIENDSHHGDPDDPADPKA